MTRTCTTPPASPSTDAKSEPEPLVSAWSLDAWIDESGQVLKDEDSERWVSYNISDLYPEWQRQAHCAGVGVNYYFGDDDEQPTMSIRQVRDASKLCDVCPVFTECLTWALSTREEYGVWAGTSGRVRRRIFKMMDNGETTVQDVVEEFRHGRGHTYRLGEGQGIGQGSSGPVALRSAGQAEREVDRGLPDAVGGEAAL
jgi:WhiB family redox-sensing transcriptional regulator